MRVVEDRDRLGPEDLGNPDRAHAIMSPSGEVILPRPRPGFRFVRWEHKPSRAGVWQPVQPAS